MRGVLLSLALVLVISGFVVAESTSDIRTDFFVSNLSADSPEQYHSSNAISWKSSITYCIATLLALIILAVILQKIIKSKKTQTKKSRKIKKARRKK